MRIFGVVSHVAKEQRRHQIGGRTTRGGVAATCCRGCVDGMNAQLIRDSLKSLGIDVVHGSALSLAKPHRKVEYCSVPQWPSALISLVREAGVEPTTFGSGGRRSIQLSYSRTGRLKSRSMVGQQQPVFWQRSLRRARRTY